MVGIPATHLANNNRWQQKNKKIKYILMVWSTGVVGNFTIIIVARRFIQMPQELNPKNHGLLYNILINKYVLCEFKAWKTSG